MNMFKHQSGYASSHILLCEVTIFSSTEENRYKICHPEPSEKYKTQVKDFKKLNAITGNIANFLWLAIFCLLACYGSVESIANLFFTRDYSENKTGSQASRAWDLHEAEGHLQHQCCHFVDQVMRIHHARCISFAKWLSEAPIH